MRDQRQVGILLQRDAEVSEPTPLDMHRMGTLANIVRYLAARNGRHHLVCQGGRRFQIVEFLSGWPFLSRACCKSQTEVRCMYYYTSTSNLSTLSSSRSLIGIPNLEGGLAFRCFQRLSFPNLATRLCTW